MHTLYLRRGKSESLKRFHPWVFSGAVANSDGKLKEGETTRTISPSLSLPSLLATAPENTQG